MNTSKHNKEDLMILMSNANIADWKPINLRFPSSEIAPYAPYGVQSVYPFTDILTYNVPDRMSFDWVLSSQWETTKDDEEEDEVGKVRMVNEVVTSDSEAGQTENQEKKVRDEKEVLTKRLIFYIFYFAFIPKNKKTIETGHNTGYVSFMDHESMKGGSMAVTWYSSFAVINIVH